MEFRDNKSRSESYGSGLGSIKKNPRIGSDTHRYSFILKKYYINLCKKKDL